MSVRMTDYCTVVALNTDPWMGFRSNPHWKDLHGMLLLVDCTLDEPWHETPVSMEYSETPLKEKDFLS